MNTQSLQLGQALRLLRLTAPVLLIRLGASLLFWLVAIVYLVIVGGISLLIANAIPLLGVILFFVAIGGLGGLYHLAYRYVFYMIKAAHVAVMSEVLANGQLPEGTGQLEFGKQKVQERFTEMNVMFVIDELVTGILRAFTGTVYQLTAWVPSDAVRTLVRIVNRVIMMALNYVDEAVLARSFYTRSESPYANARDGVVLYAMVWKPILMNAIVLMIISYIPFIVAFILFSAPIGFLIATINPALAGWAIIATLALSWLLKVAVGDSFAMAAIIATYHRETEGLTPNSEMAAKLDSVSDKFKELTQRAQEEVGRFTRQEKPKGTPQPQMPEAE